MVSALIFCIEIPPWIPSVMIYNLSQLIPYILEFLLVMVLSHKKESKQEQLSNASSTEKGKDRNKF